MISVVYPSQNMAKFIFIHFGKMFTTLSKVLSYIMTNTNLPSAS